MSRDGIQRTDRTSGRLFERFGKLGTSCLGGQKSPGQAQWSLLTEHEVRVSRVRPAESESLVECSLERKGLERVPLSSPAGGRGAGWAGASRGAFASRGSG